MVLLARPLQLWCAFGAAGFGRRIHSANPKVNSALIASIKW
jgi:hypothetical protein